MAILAILVNLMIYLNFIILVVQVNLLILVNLVILVILVSLVIVLILVNLETGELGKHGDPGEYGDSGEPGDSCKSRLAEPYPYHVLQPLQRPLRHSWGPQRGNILGKRSQLGAPGVLQTFHTTQMESQ